VLHDLRNEITLRYECCGYRSQEHDEPDEPTKQTRNLL
jgi:hypothetical protein